MSDAMADLGFEVIQRRRDGSTQYTLQANPFLRFWLVTGPDGSAELTWEFGLGEYLSRKDLSLSAQDALSLLLFPKIDVRGPAESGWVRAEVERVLAMLGSIDLVTGS